MGIFNWLGLIYIVILLIPNIIHALGHKDEAKKEGKALTILENIGRYGSMLFMVVDIPYLYYNFFFAAAGVVYSVVAAAIVMGYVACFVLIPKEKRMARALSLSILPSLLFLFCGVMLLNIPLLVFGALFAVTHIYISLRNLQE